MTAASSALANHSQASTEIEWRRFATARMMTSTTVIRRRAIRARGDKMVRNSTTQWGWPAKALHWIAAAAILILLIHGWWMTHMLPRPLRIANYAWHAALGYDLLALLVLRLLWRWVNPVPALPSELKPWEKWAAHASHFGLYVLMFAATFTGWALAGTMRTPLAKDMFGLQLPLIYVSRDRAMHELFEDSHKILAYLLAVLVVVHIVGALRHHYGKRNDVLRRMTPGLSQA
jgi:cytochrome b561